MAVSAVHFHTLRRFSMERLALVQHRWSGVAALLFATALVAVPACSKDNTGPGSTTFALVGTVNGDNGSLSGSISLTVNGTTATGQLAVVAPSAATIDLSGTYNAGTKALSASGSGYTFAGTYDGVGRMDGTMTGTASGTFVAVRDDNSTALAFCGTFTGDDAGVFNFAARGSAVAGTATTTTGTVIPLDGTLSGSSISIVNPGGGAALATGTRSGDNVSGTWDNGAGSAGTWTGARCN